MGYRSRVLIAALLPALLLLVVPMSPALAVDPPGPVRLSVLAPTSIIDTAGTHAGSVEALATRDEPGTANDRAAFVRFAASGASYRGYRTYTLPADVRASAITSIALAANFHGPTARRKPWTWSVYDVANKVWVRLGTQDHCGGDSGTEQWPCDDLDRRPWKYLRYNVIHAPSASLADFVDPSTGELRIRLAASSAGAAKLDWEALEVYSNDGSANGAAWVPSADLRWQWQLEGKRGQHRSTGGIAVGICQPPFDGGSCVRPDVFDIDLYVDPQIAGRFGWDLERAAVDVIHASGRHAIGYVTQGDAERWRPDYEQFVDFDRRCGGCLLGNPFSRRFPDEYWANFSPGRGRMNFMLQMMRARTDRVAAAGFDGIEFDIADTYANGDAPGFHVTARTQLAYNRGMARMAHEDGLAAALKNDGGQVPELEPSYDMAINEQCFQYHECDVYGAFLDAGKPVFEAEYRREPAAFCPEANAMGISAIRKSRNYELYAHPWTPCA